MIANMPISSDSARYIITWRGMFLAREYSFFMVFIGPLSSITAISVMNIIPNAAERITIAVTKIKAGDRIAMIICPKFILPNKKKRTFRRIY